MKSMYRNFWFSTFYCILILGCRGNKCPSNNIDIRFDVEMKQAYTNQNIIGRILNIKTKDNLFVCDALPVDEVFFSDFNGIAKGLFSVSETSCDDICSPFNYFLAAQSDSLVCVNNYQRLDKTDNKLTLLFKPYINLELHLRSSFDFVEVVNVQLAPENEALKRTVSIFHNKNFGFGLRRVDTVIYARALPEEPVTLTMVGRTTTTYFRRSFTIKPENVALVKRTIDF